MKVSQCSAVLLAIGLLSTSALAGNVTVNGQLISTVGTGTPPLQVSSTTEVQNLNAEFVGGVSVDGLRLANIVTVGKNGTGDFSTIQAAIDGVDASWDNPHLVFIGPGTYEEQVTTRSHVYLKGSGTNRTIIRYTGGNTLDASSATLTLGSSDRTRTPVASDLYIDSDTAGSGAMVALAVAVGTPGSTMMENVFIRANGTLASVGVYNTSATLYINDARIVADINGTWSSYGIWNDGGALHLSRVDIEAVYGEPSYAIYQLAPESGSKSSVVKFSKIRGDIVSSPTGTMTTRLISTELLQAPVDEYVTCLGVTHGDTFHANTCP